MQVSDWKESEKEGEREGTKREGEGDEGAEAICKSAIGKSENEREREGTKEGGRARGYKDSGGRECKHRESVRVREGTYVLRWRGG